MDTEYFNNLRNAFDSIESNFNSVKNNLTDYKTPLDVMKFYGRAFNACINELKKGEMAKISPIFTI